MKAITSLDISHNDVFDSCVNRIRNSSEKELLIENKSEILNLWKKYNQYAKKLEFNSLGFDTGLNNSIKDFVHKLYANQLRNRDNDKARIYYDMILCNSHQGKCPYCGYGVASTIDHYLPKSNFKVYAVLPENLVPCCYDCNSKKTTIEATEDEIMHLHPYFDQWFENSQWLHASIIESDLPIVEYRVESNDSIIEEEFERLKAHFKEFGLSSLYSILSANEISEITEKFSELRKNEIVEELQRSASTFYKIRKNYWKTAMYQALSESDWYIDNISSFT